MSWAVAVAAVVVLGPQLRWRRRTATPGPGDVVETVMLVALGLEAGLSLRAALDWARPYAAPRLGAEIGALLRRAQLNGLATQMRRWEGALAPALQPLARAVETGAALGPTLDGLIEVMIARHKAEAAARAQTLPVKLLFPLTLLMLPGLVLILAGPALMDVFSRFSSTL